jgi:hypothetical protein
MRGDERVEGARDSVRALISVPWGERSRDAVNSRPSVSGTVTRRSTVPRGLGPLINGALSRASAERAPTLARGATSAVVRGRGRGRDFWRALGRVLRVGRGTVERRGGVPREGPGLLNARGVGPARGEELIPKLSVDLTTRSGRGYGRANLWQMKAFYPGHREILQTRDREDDLRHRDAPRDKIAQTHDAQEALAPSRTPSRSASNTKEPSQRAGRARHSPTRSHVPHACSCHLGRRGRSFLRRRSPASRILSRTPVRSGSFTGSRLV